MYYYKIAEVILKSEYRLPSFEAFSSEANKEDIVLKGTAELPPLGNDYVSGSIVHRRIKDGWFFHERSTDRVGVYVSLDYTCIKILGVPGDTITGIIEWYVRIAVECMLALQGYVSIHAAAVEVSEEAFAFTGPSGLGKSTRANAWIKELDAMLINGDRPLIDVRRCELYGVPWDGKEQCFRNVHYSLKAICDIRRSESVYVRNMSFSQRRKLLMRQCFLPMWDTETASVQMANISRLAAGINIVRVFCGPFEADARALYTALQEENYLKEEKDMKVKQGFILRNVADEHILMPTGNMIGQFNGSVIMNDVSAFIWEKLQNPISKVDLLQAILDEFEVGKAEAETDLDELIIKLKEYNIIEDD